jgi:hypothetical protein
MNDARAYIEEKMQDPSFKKAYLEEKTKLDIEFMLDELTDKIKTERSYSELMKGVKKIKRVLDLA